MTPPPEPGRIDRRRDLTVDGSVERLGATMSRP
jgi:hypothetical protein